MSKSDGRNYETNIIKGDQVDQHNPFPFYRFWVISYRLKWILCFVLVVLSDLFLNFF